jgi:hypothetical protein
LATTRIKQAQFFSFEGNVSLRRCYLPLVSLIRTKSLVCAYTVCYFLDKLPSYSSMELYKSGPVRWTTLTVLV